MVGAVPPPTLSVGPGACTGRRTLSQMWDTVPWLTIDGVVRHTECEQDDSGRAGTQQLARTAGRGRAGREYVVDQDDRSRCPLIQASDAPSQIARAPCPTRSGLAAARGHRQGAGARGGGGLGELRGQDRGKTEASPCPSGPWRRDPRHPSRGVQPSCHGEIRGGSPPQGPREVLGQAPIRLPLAPGHGPTEAAIVGFERDRLGQEVRRRRSQQRPAPAGAVRTQRGARLIAPDAAPFPHRVLRLRQDGVYDRGGPRPGNRGPFSLCWRFDVLFSRRMRRGG